MIFYPLYAIADKYAVGAGKPGGSSAIVEASRWIDGILLGSLATSLAVIAIALLGFAMLMGRINVRRALSVILGCFLIFGARGIAEGLRSFGVNDPSPPITDGPPPLAYPNVSKAYKNNSNAFDPYAGATVKGR